MVQRLTAQPKKLQAKKARAEPPTAQDEIQDSALLNTIISQRDSVPLAAHNWVVRYRADATAATAELMTLVIQAAGIQDRPITADDVDSDELDKLVENVNSVALKGGLLELVRTKTAQKCFRMAYQELWDAILREAHTSEALWNHSSQALWKVPTFLTALATSVLFEVRHMATVTACQLVTSWLRIVVALNEASDTAQRQEEAERCKRGAAAISRADAFARTVQQCQSRIKDLRDVIKTLFDGIFINRFKDVHPEVRAALVKSVTIWACLLPSTFLTDSYLKYVCFALSDQDAIVRMEAVTGLFNLYSIQANLAPLSHLSSRFMTRFVELTHDVDDSVAAQGVRLLTLLAAAGKAPSEAMKTAFQLLADDSPQIRHAAAALVMTGLDDQGHIALGTKESAKKPKKTKFKAKKQGDQGHSIEAVRLAGILRVMHLLSGGGGDDDEPAAHDDVAALPEDVLSQVVEALFDKMVELRDWNLMVQWLKNETALELFGEAGSCNLACTLRHSLQLAAHGAVHSRAKHADAKARDAARQEATMALMTELPSLLKGALPRPDEAAALAGLVPLLKLELYSLRRDDKGLKGLLNALKSACQSSHATVALIKESVRSLTFAAKEGPDKVCDCARAILTECYSKMSTELSDALDAVENGDARKLSKEAAAYEKDTEMEGEAHLNLRRALQRAQILLSFNCSTGNRKDEHSVAVSVSRLMELTAKDVTAAKGGHLLTSTIMVGAINCSLVHMLDAVSALLKMKRDSPGTNGMLEVIHKRDVFAEHLEGIVAAAAAAAQRPDVAYSALIAKAQVWQMFSSKQLIASNLDPESLCVSDAAVNSFSQKCTEIILGSTLPDRKEEIAKVMAQVASFQSIQQYVVVGGHLFSTWGSESAEPAYKCMSCLIRICKKSDPEGLRDMFFNAIIKGLQWVVAVPVEEDPTEAESNLQSLVEKIAKEYTGYSGGPVEAEKLLLKLLAWCVEDVERLDLLLYTQKLIDRLSIAGTDTVLEVCARVDCDSADEAEWENFLVFKDAVEFRKEKAKVKPALSRKSGPKPPAATSRKISFAPPPPAVEEGPPVSEPEDGSDVEEDEPATGMSIPTQEELPLMGKKYRRRPDRSSRPQYQPVPEIEEEDEFGDKDLQMGMDLGMGDAKAVYTDRKVKHNKPRR